MPKPSNALKPITIEATAVVDVQAAEDGQPAKRPTFAIDAYNGGLIRVAGYYRPVVVDLAGLRASQTIPVLLDHNHEQIVGQAQEIAIGTSQIKLSGVVTGDDAPAVKVVGHARNGFRWSASIGVMPHKLESVAENTSVKLNGTSFQGPIHVVRAGRLHEVSFVAVGADETASAKVAASNHGDTEVTQMKFDKWLEAKEFDVATLTDEQRETLEAAFKAENKPTEEPTQPVQVEQTEPVDPIEQLRARTAAEEERIAGVRKACGGDQPELISKAIKEGWTVERAELEALRAARPTAPAIHMVDDSLSAPMLEAACMLTGRASEVEQRFDEQTLDAASRRYRGGIGLQELLLEAAWANGYTGRNFRDSREVMRYAFGRNIQAGFSTIDVGGILSNVSNKFLLDGFFSVERTWRNICAVRNVSDFKTVTSYRLIGKDQYEQVPPGGKLKHGTLGEEKYTNQADTYGLMLQIDRRDIINDDLGAITTTPRKLGRGSGLKINDVFWTTFLNNADFFKAANANYLEGADTDLGIDSLDQAEVAFMEQVDSDGKPIGIMPSILLVSPARSALGTTLFKALEIRDTNSNRKYPVANPHTDKFRPEVSRYLSNSAYTGASSKAWYLLADPQDLAVIEVAFLNGQESPTIETAEADFNVLGIQMRGFHDFGVTLQESRAGVKSKGEA